MFATRQEARKFMLAGNSRTTVVSTETGKRFTYRVRRPDPDRPWFVQVLTGSDNDGDYTFLGTVFPDGRYSHSRKSRLNALAPSAVAFNWFWQVLGRDGDLPEKVEVHHEGRCGRCGRALTVPESIESGFGPECINHV